MFLIYQHLIKLEFTIVKTQLLLKRFTINVKVSTKI
jgi:hypothetical protein